MGPPRHDSNDYAWAENMKRLLKQKCATVSKRKRKKLTEKEYANLQKRYRNILTRGISELPACPERDLRMGKVKQKVSGCFRRE